MFKNILNKYKLITANASIIACTYLNNKIHNILFNNTENTPKNNVSFNQFNFSTLNKTNKNLDPSNPNRKVDNKIRQIINEYRSAALYEDYADLFSFSDEIISSKDKEKLEKILGEDATPSVKKKKYDEEYLIVGDEKTVPNRSFIQLDLDKMRNPGKEANEEDLINDPEKYFQKILLFRIKDSLYATSSFCGYDLTDLKNGAMLGNKLICPTCLSEFNLENGMSEAGPNTRYLATFPVGLRKGNIVVKVPKNKIPLFTIGPVVENNELDPRHYVLIGDNETVYSCIDTLTKVFSGKLSIITNQTGNDFVDQNKLIKSFFPLKMKHAKFIPSGMLENFNITLYDEKVLSIDGIKRLITLSSGNKIPFDKVLIAVGSNRKPNEMKYKNCYELNTIRDHARIHNAIIKPETKSIAIIGNTMRALEIASSIRRYLDAIDKQNAKVYIIANEKNWFLDKMNLNENLLKMINDYLQRNRIFLFKGNKELDFEETQEENKLNKVVLLSEKYAFKLPADVFIFDNPVINSNCDFIKKILVRSTLEEESFGKLPGNIILPDERMSLHKGDRYAHIFTAGSCSALRSHILDGLIRTDNVKANFHLGYIAALNMMEVHYPFDDVVVNQTKVLDKNLYFIGNDNKIGTWDSHLIYEDKKNERFIIYYFTKMKMTGVLIYGYNKLHMYMREAMRMSYLPDYLYVSNNLNDIHYKIPEELIRRQDVVECFRQKALKESLNIDTRKYSIEDQAYTDDMMKRGLMAYKKYEENMNDEIRQKMDEVENKKKQEQSAQ